MTISDQDLLATSRHGLATIPVVSPPLIHPLVPGVTRRRGGRLSFVRLLIALLPAMAAMIAPAGAAPVTYTLSFLDGDIMSAYGVFAENLTVFAPGMLPGGRLGPVGPLWLRADGSDGSVVKKRVYSLNLPAGGNPGGDYRLVPIGDGMRNPVKAAQVRALLEGGRSAVHDAVTAAALQSAIWEAAYEAGTSGYDTDTGAFQISGYGGPINPAIVDISAKYLTAVEDGSWATNPTATAWTFASLAGDAPDFAFVSDDIQTNGVAIPEPAAVAMIAAVLLVITSRLRRRMR